MTRSIERDVDIANQRVATPPISGIVYGSGGPRHSPEILSIEAVPGPLSGRATTEPTARR
jgi:hypothetical protein